MPPAYKMVVINLIASCLLLLGIVIYRFVLKKKINLFVLLIIVSLLPLISLLRPGTYESGDFNIHLYRIMSFYDSLREGNIIPSWAGELNATYGNPLFIFNYALPYYIISFFHFIGFSFITSMKVYLGLSLFLSGIFMYIWINKLTGNNLAAFTAAIFYYFNPYHLIDVHFRATPGESIVFTLAPLLLYFITAYFKDHKKMNLICIALISQLLFMAHPMMAGIFLGISAFYIFFSFGFKKKLRKIIFSIFALFIGAVGSIYAWIPFVLFSQFTFPNPFVGYFHFVPVIQMLYSPWRYGLLFQGPYGELSPLLGYTQIFVIACSVFLLLRKKLPAKLKTLFLFWLTVLLLFLFLISSFSRFIWDMAPFLSMLQGMRLMLPIALCTSTLAGILVVYLSKNKRRNLLIYVLISVTIGSTILNWGHRRVIPEITDTQLRQNVWISTVNEGITAYFLNNRWADPHNFWFSELPDKYLEIIKGDGVIQEIERSSTKHTYLVDAKTPLLIKENTLFFPGWSLTSNNKKTKIFPGYRGVIHANLPKGMQYIEFNYADIQIYSMFKKISIITTIGLVAGFIFFIIRKYLKRFL